MIYITSDHHFYHKNIIKYENRPFESLDHMHEYMIDKWNKTITKYDTVYHLGDFLFGNKEQAKAIVSQLNGKIILVKGNHDRHKSAKWWRDCGFSDVIDGGIILDEYWLLSHEPMYITETMPYINIHGHTHSMKMNGLSHYNVCVEHHDYTPIRFDSIIKFIQDGNRTSLQKDEDVQYED